MPTSLDFCYSKMSSDGFFIISNSESKKELILLRKNVFNNKPGFPELEEELENCPEQMKESEK